MKVLLLGETAEAAALAVAAAKARRAGEIGAEVAAAVSASRARALGEVGEADFPNLGRRGGVQGAEGLVTALKWDRFRAVIEAAHPFDLETRAAAATACRILGLPLLQLHRPLWNASARGRAPREDVAAAARAAPVFARAFLWIGLDRLGPFRDRRELWTLTRVFGPPGGRYPLPRGDFALGAGPFTETHERILLSDYRINRLVLENAGSALGAPLLRAAAALALPVDLIAPPTAPPPGPLGARVASIDDALAWLSALR